MPVFAIDMVARFAQVADAIEDIGKRTEALSKRMEKSFKNIKGLLVGGFVARETIQFLKEVTRETIEFEKSQALLQNTLKQTANAAGVTADEINNLAEEMQKSTGFDDTGLRNAGTALLRFGNIQGDTLKQALRLSADLAATMGTDVPQAAETLARALEDPINGFKGLRGIVKPLSDSEKEAVVAFKAAGDEAAAQAIVLEHLKNVAGAAEAANKGLTKAQNDMVNSLNELQKTIGLTDTFQGIMVGFFESIAFAAEHSAGIIKMFSDAIDVLLGKGPDVEKVLNDIKGEGPGLEPDPAKIKARQAANEERARQASDAAIKRAKEFAQLSAALAKVNREQEVQNQKQSSDIINDTLKDAYDQALITTQTYYDAKAAIARNSSAIEIRVIDESIAAQEKLLKHSADTQKQINDVIAKRQDERAQALRKGDQKGVTQLDQTIKALQAQTAATPEQERNIRSEIQRLKAERSRAVQEGQDTERKKDEEIRKEVERLVDVENEVTAALAEQNGELAKAERIRAGRRDRELRKDIVKIGGSEQDVIDKQTIDEADRQIKEFADRAGRVRENLSNRERDIAAQIAEGQLSEADAFAKTNEAREEATKSLDELTASATKYVRTASVAMRQVFAGQVSETNALAASTSGLVKALGDLAIAQQKANRLFAEEQNAEAEIINQRAAGAITTQDALAKTDAVRRKSLDALREQLRVQEEIAQRAEEAAPGSEQAKNARLEVEKLRVSISALAATSNEVGRQMDHLFEDAFIQPFEDLITKTKSADDALKDFFKNVAASLLHIESRRLAESLFGGLFGAGGGGSLFTRTATTAVGFSSAMGNVMTSEGPMRLERFASGGIARRPTLSLFGEGRQPEAYVPLPDGRSIPVKMSGGWQGGTRVQAGPSAITGMQERTVPSVTLQLHPDAMTMTLRDWFEGEMARTLATR